MTHGASRSKIDDLPAAARILDAALPGGLEKFIARLRRRGYGNERIAIAIRDEVGRSVSHNTIRVYADRLGIPKRGRNGT